jgi:alpha-D-ribose 1-methylphosphonate 5-triphosphate diphosphatase
MRGSVVIKNARLIMNHEVVQGSLSVVNGRIDSIDAGGSSAVDAIDFEGDFLMPGMVEIHTDNFERHLMPRPKVMWAEQPALMAHDAEIACAGITTVFDALGVGEADTESVRGQTWGAVLLALDQYTKDNLLRADHYLHVRCELPAPNTTELFEPFNGHPRLKLISLMDHTPGQRQWEDIEQARVYFTGKKGWSHEKFLDKVSNSAMLQSQFSAPHRQYFVDYSKRTGIHLASHDDTTEAHVEQAFAEGASMSEFPTTVAAARYAKKLGLLTVMGGPNVVRGGSHSGNVSATELAKLGLLDVLSSDYVPGSLLSAVTRLVQEGVMSLPNAIATVTRHPAQATGLTDRGALEIGLRADLVRMRMHEITGQSSHAFARSVWREGCQVV